jgi:hypothetical protein
VTTNRHPVDELADVRKEIKKLEARERELRRVVLNGDCQSTGDEYEAVVVMQRRETLDTNGIRVEFGRERLAKFMRATEVAVVKLQRLGTNDSNEWTD